jgi:hypothetical protein
MAYPSSAASIGCGDSVDTGEGARNPRLSDFYHLHCIESFLLRTANLIEDGAVLVLRDAAL